MSYLCSRVASAGASSLGLSDSINIPSSSSPNLLFANGSSSALSPAEWAPTTSDFVYLHCPATLPRVYTQLDLTLLCGNLIIMAMFVCTHIPGLKWISFRDCIKYLNPRFQHRPTIITSHHPDWTGMHLANHLIPSPTVGGENGLSKTKLTNHKDSNLINDNSNVLLLFDQNDAQTKSNLPAKSFIRFAQNGRRENACCTGDHDHLAQCRDNKPPDCPLAHQTDNFAPLSPSCTPTYHGEAFEMVTQFVYICLCILVIGQIMELGILILKSTTYAPFNTPTILYRDRWLFSLEPVHIEQTNCVVTWLVLVILYGIVHHNLWLSPVASVGTSSSNIPNHHRHINAKAVQYGTVLDCIAFVYFLFGSVCNGAKCTLIVTMFSGEPSALASLARMYLLAGVCLSQLFFAYRHLSRFLVSVS